MMIAEVRENCRLYGDKYEGIDEESRRCIENRNEEGIAEELQLLFRRLVLRRGVDRQAGEECADDIWEVDGPSDEPRHSHDAKHKDEVGVLFTSAFFST